MSAALELSGDAKERLKELRALSAKAEAGDKEAGRELRRAVRESAPEVIAHCSDISRNYQRLLAETAAGGDALVKEAISERAQLLAEEVAGENPTPLEVLLAKRIASLWVLVELFEALLAAYFSRHNTNRPSPSYMLQMAKVQASANHRYLAAIRELARVRKLQANTPGVQFNTQINLGR